MPVSAKTKTKISQTLTPEQLEEFCKKLVGVPHGELAERIQEFAAECGISIGLSAAYVFKKNELIPWLERLSMRQEKARLIKEAGGAEDDSGVTIADEVARMLSDAAFDFVSDVDNRIDLNTEEGLAVFKELTTGISKLRKGDRDLIKQQKTLIDDTKKDLTDTSLSEDERAARMRARFGV
ncbi:MAG: hypothetical protein V4662_17755 [Verrucomicrobiota bacterium]